MSKMSYRQAYNHGSFAMNGYPGNQTDSRDFGIPYIANGPEVFARNSSVHHNGYPPPLRPSYRGSSHRLHPTIPEVPYQSPPPTPPPPPPAPTSQLNFHPQKTSRPRSIPRPTLQPPPPPPPPPPYISVPPPPPPPPPPESSTSTISYSEDQQRRMENLIDAAGPPDYDSERSNYDSDEADDNIESSTNQESEEREDTASDPPGREVQTQTQDLDDDHDNGDDDSGDDGNRDENQADYADDRNRGEQDITEGIGNEGQTVATHEAAAGTDEADRPPTRHVRIAEHHDDWQRRSHRSHVEWDEVEAPWARLSPRQLSGKRFQEDRRPRLPPPRKEPKQNKNENEDRRRHYHMERRDRNENFLDHRLPIMNPLAMELRHHDVNQKRQKPRITHVEPVYREEPLPYKYDHRQTYLPPRPPDGRMYKQKQYVDTRNGTRHKKKKEQQRALRCTGCCLFVLLVFAVLVLVALSGVLAYYFVFFDENTTNHPCSSLPEIEKGVYTTDTAPTNTFGDLHTFECNSGYIADPDTQTITCESDLTWDHIPLCLVPSDGLTSGEIGLLAGAVVAGGLALIFLIVMMCIACTNIVSSRNHQYDI